MESSRGPPAGGAALIDWFERSTKQHPFIEGAAATNLAAEGQVPGAFGRQPGGWGRCQHKVEVSGSLQSTDVRLFR